MKINFSFLKFQLPAFLWAIFIFILTTTSNGGFVSRNFLNLTTDKIGHGLVFAIFVFFLMQGLIKAWRFSFFLKKIQIISLVIAIFYGGTNELVQHYLTNNRQGEWGDFIADIIGCLVGLLMFNSVYGNLKFLDKE